MFSSPTIRLHMDIHKKDINILTNYTMMCDCYGIIKSHLKTTWHYFEHLPRRRWHFTFNNVHREDHQYVNPNQHKSTSIFSNGNSFIEFSPLPSTTYYRGSIW